MTAYVHFLKKLDWEKSFSLVTPPDTAAKNTENAKKGGRQKERGHVIFQNFHCEFIHLYRGLLT